MILLPPILIQSAALNAKEFSARCDELSNAKDWSGLEILARTQAAADPKDASAQAALGLALFAQKRADEGRAACEAALKLDPKRLDALYYLGIDCAASGDVPGVKVIASRIGSLSTDSEVSFWELPNIQDVATRHLQALLGHPNLPLVDASSLHFKPHSRRADTVFTSPNAPPLVVAMTVDAEGLPTSAQALMAPKEVAPTLESMVMKWRVEPVMIDGRPSPARFVKVIRPDDPMIAVSVGH